MAPPLLPPLIVGGLQRAGHPRFLGSLSAYAQAVVRSRDARARIVRVCQTVADPTELRLRLLDELRRVIGFEFFALVLTDPQTSVGAAPIAAVPLLNELPSLIRLKYLT
jgi:hypothetical protein